MSHIRTLIVVIAVGLAVRAVFMPFTGHSWDMYVWLKSAELFTSGHINVYGVSELSGFPWGFYAYPPVWLYWLALAKWTADVLNLGLNGLVALIKLPIVLADLGVAYLIHRIGEGLRMGERKRVALSAAYFLNPVSIFVSSIWGMFDALAVLPALLGLKYAAERRLGLSSLSLGIGTSVKLFPVLLLPVVLLYSLLRERGNKLRVVAKSLVALAVPLALTSLPYIPYANDYVAKLLFHTSNIGQFNAWTLVGALLGTSLISPIAFSSFVIFAALFLIRGKQKLSDESWLIYLFAGLIIIFLATSPKVNVQYVLWLMPFILLDLGRRWDWKREEIISVLTLNAAAVLFIISTVPPIGYTLDRLGRIDVLSMREDIIVGWMMLSAAGIAGWRFITLMLKYCGLERLHKAITSRMTLSGMMLTFLVAATIFPGPLGVQLPNDDVRLVVVDGPDSLFASGVDKAMLFLNKNYAKPNYLVIAFAPDFYNTYSGYEPERDISKYLRFRLDTDQFTERDLQEIVSNLRSEGIKVLAGLYTDPSQKLVSYGIYGYRSDWILDSHPYIVNSEGQIEFHSLLKPDGIYVSKPIKYADYIASKVRQTIDDFGFAGIMVLTGERGIKSSKDVERLMHLLSSLKSTLPNDKLLLIDGLDPFIEVDSFRAIAETADYVVVHTSPWVDRVREPLRANKTLEDYASRLEMLRSVLPEAILRKALQSVYAVDIAEGWIVPALQIRLEVDELKEFLGSGYAIYYGSRYIPYRFTLFETRQHESASY